MSVWDHWEDNSVTTEPEHPHGWEVGGLAMAAWAGLLMAGLCVWTLIA